METGRETNEKKRKTEKREISENWNGVDTWKGHLHY